LPNPHTIEIQMIGMYCSTQARFKGSTYVPPANANGFDVPAVSAGFGGDVRAATRDAPFMPRTRKREGARVIASKASGVDGLIGAFVR
jgi:hypothetical protein